MPRTAKAADTRQDRQLAILLELALTLPAAGREDGLIAAGANKAQMAAVVRLLDGEPRSASFLASPVCPAEQLNQQRWCSGNNTLVYTPDGPILAAHA